MCTHKKKIFPLEINIYNNKKWDPELLFENGMSMRIWHPNNELICDSVIFDINIP